MIKECSKCKIIQSTNNFYDSCPWYCKTCFCKIQKEFKDKNKEKTKEQKKQYHSHTKEKRAKQRKKRCLKQMARGANYRSNDQIRAFDLWKIAKKQKLKCALTGEQLTLENISLDHIQPLSKGGLNIPENLQLITKITNYAKFNFLIEDLFKFAINIVKHNKLSIS